MSKVVNATYKSRKSIIGRKVKRGPDWIWNHQGENSIGKIVKYHKKIDEDFWFCVEWGNGETDMYRTGPFNFDLYFTEDEEIDQVISESFSLLDDLEEKITQHNT